ncbi:MAG TPA: hypothetical protein DCE18_00295 [Syntrophobacteraceae bacterium]|nr:hypothetical protein [Syntrophobacteraceae bacterium]HBZ54509.1 hypothetical protein [Syntrophobacteraceae bacterium]
MPQLVRRFLLTVDGSPECLFPLRFLAMLYHDLKQVHILLCCFYSPLAPVYQERDLSSSMVEQREERIEARQDVVQGILDKARQAVIDAGMDAENIRLHTQERSVSVAQHACSLAGISRVDCVLVQKTTMGNLHGFLGGNPIPTHLRHCLAKPVWFLEGGHIDTSRAAIGMYQEDASLRAVSHAASMLAGCNTLIDLIHCDPHIDWSISSAIAEPSAPLLAWEKSPHGSALVPYLRQARQILAERGIPEKDVRVVVLPSRGDVARSIREYCHQAHVGIMVLGHSKPDGIWGFMKNSVTRAILAESRNLAVWVVQRGTGYTHEDSCC